MNSKREATFWFRAKNKLLPTSTLLLSLLLLNGAPALAEETGQSNEQPPPPQKGIIQANLFPANPQTDNFRTFYYEMAPGDTLNDEILIVNLGSFENNLKVYATHGLINDEGTTYYAKTKEDGKKELSEWLVMQYEEIALKPNEQKKVPFTISIPADTPLGKYHGGFAIERFVPAPEGGMLNTAFRKITKIDILVTDSPTEFRFKTANVFELPVYFWPALAIFIISTAYYFISKYKNGNPKKHDT